VAGEWRRLYNEELHNLYPSLNIISVTKSRCIKWAGHVARVEDMGNAYRFFTGKFEWNKQRRRARLGRKDSIRMGGKV
jgi:hypothetical protein